MLFTTSLSLLDAVDDLMVAGDRCPVDFPSPGLNLAPFD